LDLKNEATKFKQRNISATIAIDVMRFCHQINRDEVFGTHSLDQMVIFGEAHLRRILSAYAAYYNQARTHLALQKDAPLRRAVQRTGAIVAIPFLAGLHHQYVRI
jgi:hypothetical protein